MSEDFKHTIFVSVEDANPPPAEYTPARKVRVELTSDVYSQDEIADRTAYLGTVASSQIDSLLGRVAPTASSGVVIANAAAAEAPKRTRRTKEQIAADERAAAAAADNLDLSDPAALDDTVVGDLPTHSPDTTVAADPAALDDEWAVEPEPAAEVKSTVINPISDADLNSAVQKRNGELKSEAGTKAIRALIASYNPDATKVFQLAQIPVDRRVEFLNSLTAIAV